MAEEQASIVRTDCLNDLKGQASRTIQLTAYGQQPYIFKPVATTPATS